MRKGILLRQLSIRSVQLYWMMTRSSVIEVGSVKLEHQFMERANALALDYLPKLLGKGG
ncbi:hypothetical protein [Sphingobacterium thalpophilum]|uniref:hypothetical protein n=1 Tax=Sphingobacterium thalpophilum TaxID=259 RepID=UPI0024A726CB|nr:hypothetical protein [Sphingobacterium thalpophilum]